LMVLALARGEENEPLRKFRQGTKAREIPMEGISAKAGERLVRDVLGKDLPAHVVSRLVDQAGGNALYLEELMRAYAESGSCESVPGTILAMLQARIGRLDDDLRRTLRAASVFGRTFWRSAVQALLESGASTDRVQGWLDALVDAELIERNHESRILG